MKSPKIHHVLVYTDKEGIPGWWTFVAGAAIGLRRASKNKEMWTKNTVFDCCRARKNVKIVRDFFFNTRTYEYLSLIHI